MALKSLLVLSTSLAVANCGLLGQIAYADTGFYNHQQPRYSDATKVSYSSVSIPNFYATNPNPNYGQHQRQGNYNQQPTTGYAQYSPVIQQQQSNYIQSSSAVAGSPFVQQSYSSAPFIQNVQYPSQQAYTNVPQQQSYSYNNYGNSLGSSFEQIFQNQQLQQHQHYGVQQSLPVQNTYQSVQPLHPQVTPKPVLKTVSVQHFPALPEAQQVNNYAVQTKNAHHYPATVLANKAPANVAYQTSWTHNSITQQQPKQQKAFISSTSSKGSKSVFRTSFSDVAKPAQKPILAPVRQQAAAPAVRPAITYAAVAPITAPVAVGHHSSATAAPQVITSGPYFTHTVIPSGQSRPSSSSASSLANNPINIPSSALVAPIPQNNNQQQFQQRVQQTQPQVQLQQTTTTHQQQPQGQTAAFRSFSPSTSVSHAKFSGMGVQYEW